jgi:hypothetical protein
MSEWKSVAEMASELKLESPVHDQEGVRAELRREMAGLHPDKNGGNFASSSDETRFHSLADGLNFLDRQQSMALVPIRDLPAIMAAMRQALQPTTQEAAVAARTEYRVAALGEAHTRYALPRIGSGVFAAVCAALLTFSGSLKDNPVFGVVLESHTARLMLGAAFLYSGIFFIMTWLLEQREAARVEWLATEAGMRRTLSRAIKSSSDRWEFRGFSFSDYCEALSDNRFHRRTENAVLFAASAMFIHRRGLSPSSAERLAKLHIEELERRGVIKKHDERSLDITYEVDRDVADDLRE